MIDQQQTAETNVSDVNSQRIHGRSGPFSSVYFLQKVLVYTYLFKNIFENNILVHLSRILFFKNVCLTLDQLYYKQLNQQFEAATIVCINDILVKQVVLITIMAKNILKQIFFFNLDKSFNNASTPSLNQVKLNQTCIIFNSKLSNQPVAIPQPLGQVSLVNLELQKLGLVKSHERNIHSKVQTNVKLGKLLYTTK